MPRSVKLRRTGGAKWAARKGRREALELEPDEGRAERRAAGRPVARTRASASRGSAASRAPRTARASGSRSGGGTGARSPVRVAGRTSEVLRPAPTGRRSTSLTRIAPSFRSAFDPAQPLRQDRPRDGGDVAAEIGGEARRDERAALLRGLDDEDEPGEPGDDPVAHREVSRERPLRPGSNSEMRGPARHDLRQKRGMLGRIADVDAATEDRDRRPPFLERRAVRRRVDAAREARDDDDAGPREPPARGARASRPAREARRAPTSATAGASVSGRPRSERRGGGSGISRRRDGYSASPRRRRARRRVEEVARRLEAGRRRRVEEGADLLRRRGGERGRLPGRTPGRFFDRARREEEPGEDAGPRLAHA